MELKRKLKEKTPTKESKPPKDPKAEVLKEVKEVKEARLSDILWLESKLETAGEAKLAQITRCCLAIILPEEDDDDIIWSCHVIKGNIKARWIVQREIFLEEEIQALRKTLPLIADENGKVKEEKAEAESRLSAFEQELKRLDSEYWEHKYHLRGLEAFSPTFLFGRALQAHRKDPNWYLSDWLRLDCAGRGGCCGRDCGCCEKPRGTHRNCDWDRGHCTGACGCCIRTKGSSKEAKLDDDLGACLKGVPAIIGGLYGVQLHFAYIWGLDIRDDFMRFAFD